MTPALNARSETDVVFIKSRHTHTAGPASHRRCLMAGPKWQWWLRSRNATRHRGIVFSIYGDLYITTSIESIAVPPRLFSIFNISPRALDVLFIALSAILRDSIRQSYWNACIHAASASPHLVHVQFSACLTVPAAGLQEFHVAPPKNGFLAEYYIIWRHCAKYTTGRAC